LAHEVANVRGKTSKGGRRPRRPRSKEDALQQIETMCGKLVRWYDQAKQQDDPEDEEAFPLADLSDEVRKPLEAARTVRRPWPS
jgi:hypothetical protein